MNKSELEAKLVNCEVCGDCHACDYCGEIGQDCVAFRILKEIAGYPSFEKSMIQDKKEGKPQ